MGTCCTQQNIYNDKDQQENNKHNKQAFSKCYCMKRIPKEDTPKTQSHYVYIMTNKFYPRDYIKIGRTINLPRRINELNDQMLSDHTLPIYFVEVEDDKDLEQYLHQQFAEYRISKHREWFQMNPHTVIKAIRQYQLERNECEIQSAQNKDVQNKNAQKENTQKK